jgi:hypothetical protein
LPKARRRERDSNVVRDQRFAQDQSNLIQIKPYLKRKQQVLIVPRNVSQENYLELLKNPKNSLFLPSDLRVRVKQ